MTDPLIQLIGEWLLEQDELVAERIGATIDSLGRGCLVVGIGKISIQIEHYCNTTIRTDFNCRGRRYIHFLRMEDPNFFRDLLQILLYIKYRNYYTRTYHYEFPTPHHVE